jgi:hypothetical protein
VLDFRHYFSKEDMMHISEIVWWIYTALVALTAVFFLIFAYLVKEKGK